MDWKTWIDRLHIPRSAHVGRQAGSVLQRQRGRIGTTARLRPASFRPGATAPVTEGRFVRPYRPEDRVDIARLCLATGFLGRPVDSVLTCGRTFRALYVDAYLDHQPDLAWVAVCDGAVRGYLLGAKRADFGVWITLAGIRAVLALCHDLPARDDPRYADTADFLDWLVRRALAEQPRHPHGAAHLHFNLAADARGHGLAQALWHHFETALRKDGTPACYGILLSFPGHRPERAYRRYGLTVHDRRPTTLFRNLLPQPAELVCVSKRLH